MSKSTKYFELFSALKAGGDKGVEPTALAKTLNFSMGSLAVYIHALRHNFGAVIESVRNGRTVTAYRLVNIAECEKTISPNRKPRTSKTPSKKAKAKANLAARIQKISKTKAPKVAPRKRVVEDGPVEVIEDMSITEVDFEDLDDIKAQLGIA